MISFDDYKSHLLTKGAHLGEVRKNRADMITNVSFTGDPSYRKVYILDKDEGWKFTDARFSKHAAASIQKDAVDSYLQFRPKEHYPVGTFVFIPDDTSYELDINMDDPLWDGAKNLWLICGRTDDKQFVHYLVMKCTWKLRWVLGYGDKKKLLSCWCVIKNANSYTSGVWHDTYTTGLDNLSGLWLPDTAYVYGDNREKYGLDNTQTLDIQMRVMVTVNEINPNCYMLSKILDMVPKGVLKISMKADDYNVKRDNVALKVCDYYNDSGDIVIDPPVKEDDPDKTSTISYMAINADGELEPATLTTKLDIGNTYYYSSEFTPSGPEAHWRIQLVDEDSEYSESDRLALERLMVIREIDDHTISLRPGKSNRIKGLKFRLIVADVNGDYESTIEVEVNT